MNSGGAVYSKRPRSLSTRADMFLGVKAFFPRAQLPKATSPTTSTPTQGPATVTGDLDSTASNHEFFNGPPESNHNPEVSQPQPNSKAAGTPASIIIGRFQFLKKISSETDSYSLPGREHLCEYIDIIKGKHDRLYIVSEHYTNSIRTELNKIYRNEGFEERTIRKYAFQILLALNYLNSHGIVHRNIASHNILLDCDKNVKMSDYGMFEMTMGGKYVNFPIGTPNYIAPDTFIRADSAFSQTPPSPKEDVWSVGILLIEMVCGERPWDGLKDAHAVAREVVALAGHTADLLGFNANMTPEQREKEQQQRLAVLMSGGRFDNNGISEGLKDVIALCLKVSPIERPTVDQLLNHPYFSTLYQQQKSKVRWVVKPFLRCLFLDEEKTKENETNGEPTEDTTEQTSSGHSVDPLQGKPLAEVFHFWKLAGGDIEKEIPRELQISAPILRIPTIVRLNGPTPHRNEDPAFLYDERIIAVSLADVRRRFTKGSSGLREEYNRNRPTKLPLSVREKDIDYQRERVDIFRELLSRPNNPTTKQEIIREAKIDLPPVLRAEIWAYVLGVHGDCQAIYDAIDKESDGPFDHQIELDIPRCHQYNELLASPEGHRKFRRILKAWVAYNSPHLVYWQGVDSLLAPFLALNFNNEAKAFCCLQAMINKYLSDFFIKDNVSYLQEHLIIYRQLLAYEDPELVMHLHKIGFHPDLYAIPWFLTLFTHIFVLDKIYWILDTMLLGPRSLSLFLALAMMQQLRSKIMNQDFTACISFFSNLPQIDIEAMVSKALTVFEATPPSLLARKYSSEPHPDRYWEVRIPLEQLKEEFAPRISLEDVLMYKHSSVILDIRKQEEYEKEHFIDSIHINLATITAAGMEQYRGSRIIIVAPRGDIGPKFANKLVSLKFPSVCVLNGGIDALKASPKALMDSMLGTGSPQPGK